MKHPMYMVLKVTLVNMSDDKQCKPESDSGLKGEEGKMGTELKVNRGRERENRLSEN